MTGKTILKSILMICVCLCILFSLSACGDAKKRSNAEAALEAKRQEQAAADEAAANDKEPPVFSCTMEKACFEVDDTIDYSRLLLSLTATDNIDGNLTKSIQQESSTVAEHCEGSYEIIYSVADKAGNKASYTLPVEITSKYSPAEKARLNSCVKAYNKLTAILKAPASLTLSNINTNESGSIVVVNYSAQNGFGAYIRGRAASFSADDTIAELSDTEIPNNFTIGEYTYEYDDIKSFSDYYHQHD